MLEGLFEAVFSGCGIYAVLLALAVFIILIALAEPVIGIPLFIVMLFFAGLYLKDRKKNRSNEPPADTVPDMVPDSGRKKGLNRSVDEIWLDVVIVVPAILWNVWSYIKDNAPFFSGEKQEEAFSAAGSDTKLSGKGDTGGSEILNCAKPGSSVSGRYSVIGVYSTLSEAGRAAGTADDGKEVPSGVLCIDAVSNPGKFVLRRFLPDSTQ